MKQLRPTWRCGFLVAAIAMSVVVAGCGDQSRQPPLEKVTLGDLAPSPIPVPGAMDEVRNASRPTASAAALPPTNRPLQIVVQRAVFDRNSAKLAMGLSLLDPPDLADDQLAAWRANGFGIGQIARDKLAMWTTNLPKPHTTNVYVIGAGPSASPLTLIGKMENLQRVRVIDRQGDAKVYKLIGGQWQMLLNLVPALEGPLVTPRLEMMPHHYGPQPSLLPRMPQEKQLDGESFTELALSHPMPPGKVWVFWADCAQPHAPIPEADKPPVDESRIGITGPAPVVDPQDRLPGIPLAEAMLTGRRGERPVQIVLMIAPAP